MEEFDVYLQEYFGYVDAIATVSQRRRQRLAVFWEHFLVHVHTEKKFTVEEQWLYERNRRPNATDDARFTELARRAVDEYCRRREIAFIDPIEHLRRSEKTVFIDYLHYTREGNEVMANAIYDVMRDIFRDRASQIKVQEP